MGIINVGGNAVIHTSGEIFKIGFKEALYLGKGTSKVVFESELRKNLLNCILIQHRPS